MDTIPQKVEGIEPDEPISRSTRHLLRLVAQLGDACETAHQAYAAEPEGAWGSHIAELKTRLVDLTREIAATMGLH